MLDTRKKIIEIIDQIDDEKLLLQILMLINKIYTLNISGKWDAD